MPARMCEPVLNERDAAESFSRHSVRQFLVEENYWPGLGELTREKRKKATAIAAAKGCGGRRCPSWRSSMTKRQRISGNDIPEHTQPFPTAVRIANLIFSSAIGGRDAGSGTLPSDPNAQITQAFANMRRTVEAGGGTIGDIAKVTIYLNDRKDRDAINSEWVKMFPEESDRPVRHTIKTEIPPGRAIQLEFVAVIG